MIYASIKYTSLKRITSTDTITSIDELSTNRIIIYNDDINTFDWVIASLIELCKHSPIQAEQCTLLIHLKGKASVKEGLKKRLNGQK